MSCTSITGEITLSTSVKGAVPIRSEKRYAMNWEKMNVKMKKAKPEDFLLLSVWNPNLSKAKDAKRVTTSDITIDR
jgi:hypothetical protein